MATINPATARLNALLAGQLGAGYPQLPTPLGPNGAPRAAPPSPPPVFAPRKLSPQEETAYFLTPVHSGWFGGNHSWAPTIGADSRRIAVIWSASGQVWITTDPSQAPLASGIFLSDTSGPFIATEKDFGNLVSLPWFASAAALPASPTLFSCEILLREWPEGGL